MKVTIKQRKENPLLERVELEGSLQFDGATPGNAVLAEALARELKSEPVLVVVKHIYTKFGAQEASFQAVAYANAEAKSKVEMVTKHMKKKSEKKEGAAEEKKEEAAQPAEKEAVEEKGEKQPAGEKAVDEKEKSEEQPAGEKAVDEKEKSEEQPAEEEKKADKGE